MCHFRGTVMLLCIDDSCYCDHYTGWPLFQASQPAVLPGSLVLSPSALCIVHMILPLGWSSPLRVYRLTHVLHWSE